MSYILLAIDLNNYAIAELQKGNITKAYELLTSSCQYVAKANHRFYKERSRKKSLHGHFGRQHDIKKDQMSMVNSSSCHRNSSLGGKKRHIVEEDEHQALLCEERVRHHRYHERPEKVSPVLVEDITVSSICSYSFGWIDCTLPISHKINLELSDSANPVIRHQSEDGSSFSFLYLKFLSIGTPMGRMLVIEEEECCCGFAWAIWYNIAIVATALSNLTESIQRQYLLEEALVMFERSERIIKEKEKEFGSGALPRYTRSTSEVIATEDEEQIEELQQLQQDEQQRKKQRKMSARGDEILATGEVGHQGNLHDVEGSRHVVVHSNDDSKIDNDEAAAEAEGVIDSTSTDTPAKKSNTAKTVNTGEEEVCKDWYLLALSILNNQACILKDLRKDDIIILERLINMGLTLTNTLPILNESDQQPFLWTIQLLLQDRYAPAA